MHTNLYIYIYMLWKQAYPPHPMLQKHLEFTILEGCMLYTGRTRYCMVYTTVFSGVWDALTFEKHSKIVMWGKVWWITHTPEMVKGAPWTLLVLYGYWTLCLHIISCWGMEHQKKKKHCSRSQETSCSIEVPLFLFIYLFHRYYKGCPLKWQSVIMYIIHTRERNCFGW